MSLVKLTPDRFEVFTTVTNPTRTFTSSSSGAVGSVKVHVRQNRVLKEVDPLLDREAPFDDSETAGRSVLEVQRRLEETSDISGPMSHFVDVISSERLSPRHDTDVKIRRITPASLIERDLLKKAVIRDVLSPYYRTVYPSANYSYVNYHALNFFTSSTVPSDAAVIYPVSYSGGTPQTVVPTSGFSFDFYLNPRYPVSSSQSFKAGTILHVSSTFALSLVTGSGVDHNGVRTGFRLMLQLSSSADIPPSSISLTGSNNNRPKPHNLVFLTDDNSLSWNHWHHVSVRWGTSTVNHGSGSFFIDRQERGVFCVPSGSITTQADRAAALFVGNFFEGGPAVDQARFFNSASSTNEGHRRYVVGSLDPSGSFFLRHPLNAEIHDVKIFGKYRSTEEVATSSVRGPDNLDDLLFYLPVSFVKETFARQVLRTPVEQFRREINAPVNPHFSMQVGGHDVSVENFLRDFVNGEYPRLFHLTSSVYTGSTASGISADDYFRRSPDNVKRNLTILPCDNGLFVPNFELLRSGVASVLPVSGSPEDRFVTDVGGLNLKIISLLNLLPTTDAFPSTSGSLERDVYGASPSEPTLPAGSTPAVLQVTRDNSSNHAVIFDVPSLFYGRRIRPRSFTVTDPNLSGSSGRIAVTLRDDGVGGLYRADAATPHAEWNSVGSVFYNEGVAIVKSPNLPHFGKDRFDVALSGEQNIYVSKVSVVAGSGQVNSSSNPSYVDVPVSLNANDLGEKFVYITGIAFHDENLNVVARTNLSQPVIKRSGDRIVFRTKMDY